MMNQWQQIPHNTKQNILPNERQHIQKVPPVMRLVPNKMKHRMVQTRIEKACSQPLLTIGAPSIPSLGLSSKWTQGHHLLSTLWTEKEPLESKCEIK